MVRVRVRDRVKVRDRVSSKFKLVGCWIHAIMQCNPCYASPSMVYWGSVLRGRYVSVCKCLFVCF